MVYSQFLHAANGHQAIVGQDPFLCLTQDILLAVPSHVFIAVWSYSIDRCAWK